jgi:CRISPR-associated helicase Cas3
MPTIEPLALPLVEHARYVARGLAPPYAYQAAAYDASDRPAILLATPTGSGKTRAGAFPILDRGESAIFVYPTNALAEDQERSIRALLADMGDRSYFLEPGQAIDPNETRGAVVVVRIDALTLEQFRRDWRGRNKGAALRDVFRYSGNQLLVLTNPDTLYLLLALRYAEGYDTLARIADFTLVLDEFHLYHGAELAKILFLAFASKELRLTRRTVLLSATPDDSVLELVRRVLDAEVIAPRSEVPSVGHRLILSQVHLETRPDGEGKLDEIAHRLVVRRSELERLRAETTSSVPALVILNSVIQAIVLEDELVRLEFPREAIGIYRGLSSRAIRDVAGKLVVIGTSAVEVGVDFDTHYLIFEAGSASSFVQRFGRVGRHRPGHALLHAPERIGALFDGAVALSRDALAALVRTGYPPLEQRAWFARTPSGLFVVVAAAEGLASGSAEARTAVDRIVAAYAEKLEGAEALARARRWLRTRWARRYRDHLAFRGGAGSIQVFDLRERDRRGSDDLARYEADALTLLERANLVTELQDADGDIRAVVRGYGRRRSVVAGVARGFEGLATGDDVDLIVRVEGEPRRIGDALRSRVVGVFPEEVRARLDWRFHAIATDTDRRVLLFGDEALVAHEELPRG